MAGRTEIPPSEGVRGAEGDAAHSVPVEPSEAAEGSGSMAQQKQASLNGWFAELKRRRVVRTLVGYGIASFAVLQIVEPVMHGRQACPIGLAGKHTASMRRRFPRCFSARIRINLG